MADVDVSERTSYWGGGSVGDLGSVARVGLLVSGRLLASLGVGVASDLASVALG